MLYRALWLVMFLLFPFAGVAHADTLTFECRSEEMANQIAEALTSGGQQAADIVAEPYLALGECMYFNEPVFVYIVHKGATFGDKFKVTVVGVSHKIGAFPDFYGLIPTSELSEQLGSI